MKGVRCGRLCSRLNQPLSDIQPRGAIDVVSSVLVICRGPPCETPPSAVPPLHCLRLSQAGAVWQSLDSPSRRWPNSRRQRAPQARRNWPQKRSRRLSIPLRHRKNARRDGGDSPKGRCPTDSSDSDEHAIKFDTCGHLQIARDRRQLRGHGKLRSSRAFKRAKPRSHVRKVGRPGTAPVGSGGSTDSQSPGPGWRADYFTSNQGKLAELKAMFLDEAKKK